MLDPLIKNLSEHRKTITRDQFNKWRRDPVTEELFLDMNIALLDRLWDPLPDSSDETVCKAHQREGAKATLEEIESWQPQSVTKEEQAEQQDTEVEQ